MVDGVKKQEIRIIYSFNGNIHKQSFAGMRRLCFYPAVG